MNMVRWIAVTLGVGLSVLAIGLMVLGWFGHTVNVSVMAGLILAFIGAVLTKYTVQMLRRLSIDHDRRRHDFMQRRREDEGRRWPHPQTNQWAYSESRLSDDFAVASDAPSQGITPTESDGIEKVTILARDRLARIRFQRGYKADWSAMMGFGRTATLPIGAEVSRAGGESSTEQPITLPDAIAMLREYLANAAEVAGGFMVGIDELDKISTPEQAELFLNEIKAIFGVPNCYFVLSVSEDAAASFERRGMPFRDVLDSTFDDVVRIGYFSFADSQALLSGRTLEMPIPFIALCHILAGGVPRDVIRMARRLFELRDVSESGRLGIVCPALVAVEVEAKRDGTITMLRRLPETEVGVAILRWLAQSESMEPITSTPQLNTAKRLADDPTVARRLAREFATYRYLAATIIEFFSDDRAISDFEEAERTDGNRSFEQLARARQAFGIGPELAWDYVSAFRAGWELEPSTMSVNESTG